MASNLPTLYLPHDGLEGTYLFTRAGDFHHAGPRFDVDCVHQDVTQFAVGTRAETIFYAVASVGQLALHEQ